MIFEWALLAIAILGILTWVAGEKKPPYTDAPPPRKYPKPDRPKNDDPDRWYG